MSVTSYLEIYLAIFGWRMYDEIWNVMESVGFAYLPFIGLVIRNFSEPYRSQETRAASTTSIKRMEIDVVTIMTVIVLATQPYLNVSLNGFNYTQACGQHAGTYTGGATGTTYDQQFTALTLGGTTAKIPIWWYGVLAFTGGFNDAIILAIPCTTNIREMKYSIQNSRVVNPLVRKQLQQFHKDCWRPSMAKFMRTNAVLPASIPEGDIYWPGSEYFLTTPGFYDHYRSKIEIPGFPYNATRDLEYDPAIYIPVDGRPFCKAWWNDPVHGLRQALVNSVDQVGLGQLIASAPISQQRAEDIAIKTVFQSEEATFTGLQDLEAYAPRNSHTAVSATAAKVGAMLESFNFYPKIYMVKVAAPIIQAAVLMMFYILLPFPLVLSSYSIGTVINLSIILFAIKFWTVLWAIADWLDNNLLAALQPNSWYRFYTGSVVPDVINFTTGMLFIVFPIFWLGVLTWAGFKTGNAINSTIDTTFKPSQNAGSRGGEQIKKTGGGGKLS